ncbi:MAG: ATP-dependent zinc metalloprotease FtsH [Alphaproteobacteria bacterium]
MDIQLQPDNKNKKSAIVWIVLLILVFAIPFYMPKENFNTVEVPFSELIKKAENNEISEIVIQGRHVSGKLKGAKSFKSFVPEDSGLIPLLKEKNIKITAIPEDKDGFSLADMIVSWLPMIILLGLWIFFMRQMASSNGKAMSFGKSRAKLLNSKDKITFKDVAGIQEAKQELEEVVDFLKEPNKFQRLGGRIPKGVLLVGPPGTGKTLLAKAIAGEANVPFFTISGSDFVEMFVGVGASRVRDMFDQAKKNAPCILFIDEIDAVGRQRGAGLGGGNDEREQTLNQLLVEMDGFETNSGVILIAATNRPDVLDPALLRPGRFDRQVVVANPDIHGREEILAVHVRKVPLAPDVDIRVIARGTPGFSGADLANLVNEAALLAARRNKFKVTMKEMEDAKDKVMMGTERKSMVMDEKEKEMTAFHEAGHAICSLHLPESDPLHKVTIVPRGQALGLTMQLPEKDKYSQNYTYLQSRLSILFGGRVAEEIVYGKNKVTTGASNDISVATSIARRMVTEWGMSESLGPVAYEEPESEVFLGRSVARRKNISDKTAEQVDKQIRQIIDMAYARTQKILSENRKELNFLAKALCEYETLTAEEIALVIKGESLKLKEDKPSVNVRPSVPTCSDEDDKVVLLDEVKADVLKELKKKKKIPLLGKNKK